MALLKASPSTHQRLARLRRRSWAAIGFCLLFRIGDAALHAQSTRETATEAVIEAAYTTCLVDYMAGRSTFFLTDNSNKQRT